MSIIGANLLPRRRAAARRSGVPAARQVAVFIHEMILAAEAQQRIAILRKRRRSPPHLRDHSRVVEHRVPHEVRQKNFQQRREPPDFPARPASAFTIFDEGASRLGTNTGPRLPCAFASASVNS